MATFNYVIGRTEAYRSVECGIDIPSLWTATVISGMPEGKTMNSGSAATQKEAVNALIYKMKQAGYTGFLYLVEDATAQRKPKPVAPVLPVKKRKTMALKARSSPVKPASSIVVPKKSGKASERVTIKCWLDTSRETPKAYKLHNSAYVAKSICSFEPKGRLAYVFDTKTQSTIAIRHGEITMPSWLYEKL
ncbi:MAG: hypothetical protein ACJ8LM_17875 [Candidatus Udaeobacter sp.]